MIHRPIISIYLSHYTCGLSTERLGCVFHRCISIFLTWRRLLTRTAAFILKLDDLVQHTKLYNFKKNVDQLGRFFCFVYLCFYILEINLYIDNLWVVFFGCITFLLFLYFKYNAWERVLFWLNDMTSLEFAFFLSKITSTYFIPSNPSSDPLIVRTGVRA